MLVAARQARQVPKQIIPELRMWHNRTPAGEGDMRLKHEAWVVFPAGLIHLD